MSQDKHISLDSTTPSQSDPGAGQTDDSHCAGCPTSDTCRQVWSLSRRGPFSPVGLSLSSAVAFLLPIITAIIAGVLADAYLSGPEPLADPSVGNTFSLWIVIAVFVGLAVGAGVAWLIMPFIRRHFHVEPSSPKNNPGL